ncbi:MAG: phosphoenolpyruvate--protein phosphotransferase [Verrucomicrobiae bacterium]|nr:phosphoenolpyruvate--protein phosphotransferase [Verrucomicrobiae bacterium]
MSLEQHFTCPLPNGVHARPASALEEVVRGFDADVILVNQRTSRTANSKSILAIVGADIRHDDPCILKVSGPDEKQAMAALTLFLQDKFPHCDESPMGSSKPSNSLRLPPCLSQAGALVYRGTPVVPGIAQAPVARFDRKTIPAVLPKDGEINPAIEWPRLETALEKLITDCDTRLSGTDQGIEIELLKVHRSIARDIEFRRLLSEEVNQHRHPAAEAIANAEKHFSDVLIASGSELLCDRTLDIQDVCSQLLLEFYGRQATQTAVKLTRDSIVVADSLTPGQFLALDRKFLKGLVLARAGGTSHTVILARAFNIPTLAGVENLADIQFNGHEVVVDADVGVLVTRLTEAAQRYYALEKQRIAGRRAHLRTLSMKPAGTVDGHLLEIAANIATGAEAAGAFEAGAEGIGLFRTEMLFLDRKSPPDEAEQLKAYQEVLAAAKGRPVVIRTLDVGGDKKLDYLNLPPEENPFLGCRAVRIYPEFEVLFRTQIRALVRASAFGKLRVMIPMIATLDEARWVKKVIASEQKKCAEEKTGFDQAMPVGAMIEVPSAVFALKELAGEFDFFSIGSNDLLQYFMAADRMNGRLGALYNPLQPSFLRFLRQAVEAAHACKKEISLCGEMGGQARYIPLLAGLELDKISASAPAIAGLKAELGALRLSDCRELVDQALDCTSAGEVSALLETFASRHNPPLIEESLILLNSDATTKEEAIKQAADQLFVLGRTENSRSLEEAVWEREATYSTGFGQGFAIPHCKSNAVRYNSMVLLKPRQPLAWNSLDGQPVRVMILLAVREANSTTVHMKVLARLARRIMDPNFREELENATDPATLCDLLLKSLDH